MDLILTLTGGEPFLKEEIYDLVEYVNNFLEVKYLNFISNGTVLPKKNLFEIKKVFKYYISLESCEEFDNDQIRGKGVLKKVLENIKVLQSIGYKIGIMTTLLNSNIKGLINNFDKLNSFLKEYKISEIIFERFVPVGRAKDLKSEVVDNDKILNFFFKF
jgi:MoaA/NifB/PqqE/SkfB family radical SAM enzyme